MSLETFLLLDALFLVGLTWALWRGFFRRTTPALRLPPSANNSPDLDQGQLPVRRIQFEGNSAALSRQAAVELDALASWLKTNTTRIEVQGSADDTGHLTRNRRLARERAAVVQRALVALGVAANRLRVSAVEPQRGANEAARQALRCVTFQQIVVLG